MDSELRPILQMPEATDYFSNHHLKTRFPWRLYHAPITRALSAAILEAPGPFLLNIGSGPILQPEELVGPPRRWTICDIDPRAIEEAQRRYDGRLERADVITAGAPLPYSDSTFDIVVATDVIEHVLTPLDWVRDAIRVLRPGGHLFLTTPNYGSQSLRLIENTALEAIARYQGFSRRDLHPTKFDSARLDSLLREAGAEQVDVSSTSFGWVLLARAKRTGRPASDNHEA